MSVSVNVDVLRCIYRIHYNLNCEFFSMYGALENILNNKFSLTTNFYIEEILSVFFILKELKFGLFCILLKMQSRFTWAI